MLEALFSSATGTAGIALSTAFIYTVAAGLFGLLISFTYRRTGKVSCNFARTLIVLPMLVCVVMLVVNGNLGTSVAIVGAFGLIRFRSLQGNSRDIAFVFFAMTAGLTCSIGYLAFGAGITVFICIILLILHLTHFAENRSEEKELRITIPENLDYTGIFDDLSEQYTNSFHLIRVKTVNMGSLYELTYRIELKNEAKEKQFLDEIRCRNGNLTVICGKCEYGAAEEL